jgi:hypothetical protein
MPTSWWGLYAKPVQRGAREAEARASMAKVAVKNGGDLSIWLCSVSIF